MRVTLIAIYNAQRLEQYIAENFVLNQIISVTVGILIVSAFQYFDFDVFYRVGIYAYRFGVLLLIVLFLSPNSIAATVNGAKRGFSLPELSLQPSEFTKITTIIYLSAIISKHKEKFKVSTLKSDGILLIKIGVV